MPRAKSSGKKRRIRDNFSHSTIRRLRDMAGNICSNPGCKAFTYGSLKLRDNAGSIGVAAHICAAAPGGPRFDDAMSVDERKSVDNGMWLCQSCSKLIDIDSVRFPVSLLRTWKKEAEERAMHSIGQRVITQQEHDIAVRKSITQAIAHHAVGYVDPLQAPVAQIISGYEANLEELDPRFGVMVKASNNLISHQIYAKSEDANFQLNIRNTHEIQKSLTRMFEYGEALHISSDDFTFSGSKLFEGINARLSKGPEHGTLSISARTQDIEVSISVTDDNLNEIEICTFTAELCSGSKKCVVRGVGLGGLIKIEVEIDIPTGENKTNFTFTLEAWRGQKLTKLSYFPRFLKAAQMLDRISASTLTISLTGSNTGKTALAGCINPSHKEEFVHKFIWIIYHIDSARQLAHELPDLKFNETEIDEKSNSTLLSYLHLRKGANIAQPDPGGVLCTAVLNDTFSHLFEDYFGTTQPIKLDEEPKQINVLGNKIVAPSIQHFINSYTPYFYCGIEDKKNRVLIEATDSTTITTSLVNEPWAILES